MAINPYQNHFWRADGGADPKDGLTPGNPIGYAQEYNVYEATRRLKRSPVYTIPKNKGKFAYSDPDAATYNTQILNDIKDDIADSGAKLIIEEAFFHNGFEFPRRVIGGYSPGMAISFALEGARPGTPFVNINPDPTVPCVKITGLNAPHNAGDTPAMAMSNLNLVSKGPGLDVYACSNGFLLDSIQVSGCNYLLSETSFDRSLYAVKFRNCFGSNIIGQLDIKNNQMHGLLIEDNIHFNIPHIFAKGNLGRGITVRGVSYVAANHFGTLDAEGNGEENMIFDKVQQSKLMLYSEYSFHRQYGTVEANYHQGYATNCYNIEFFGSGLNLLMDTITRHTCRDGNTNKQLGYTTSTPIPYGVGGYQYPYMNTAWLPGYVPTMTSISQYETKISFPVGSYIQFNPGYTYSSAWIDLFPQLLNTAINAGEVFEAEIVVSLNAAGYAFHAANKTELVGKISFQTGLESSLHDSNYLVFIRESRPEIIRFRCQAGLTSTYTRLLMQFCSYSGPASVTEYTVKLLSINKVT